MKRVVLILAMVLIPVMANAFPFLVCDPQTNVDNYVIYNVSGTTCAPADISGKTPVDTPYPLHYDLGGLPQGAFHMCIAAENSWGQSNLVPFGDSKAFPGAPVNLRLSNQ